MSIYLKNAKGDWSDTFKFLERNREVHRIVDKLVDTAGSTGVTELSKATPKDTGKAASSWSYEIEKEKGSTSVIWTNSDNSQQYNIVELLQYGHGTGTGGYVTPRDFINPPMKAIYEKMADVLWKEVIK